MLDFETRSRELSIRTYRIVPLAPQAGVVQWLDNTIPLGDLLAQAHHRYLSLTIPRIYPKDWTLPKCRKEMQTEHSKTNSTNESKLLLYQTIEQNLHAVFGKLLFELYRSPNEWYNNRRKFMRSLATTSITGYVLGIGKLLYYYPGDRHAQNILFDKKTGELIHIDLGIAFDQGKLLSTPEIVPFRLTRDLGNTALILVDVMGITRTRGVFMRGCEETLRLLRNDSEILFTLLDVFRYDPLYTWLNTFDVRNISAMRTNKNPMTTQIDKETGSEKDFFGNKQADRALFGVRKKLTTNLSVECHVSELINDATDPSHLRYFNLSNIKPNVSWLDAMDVIVRLSLMDFPR